MFEDITHKEHDGTKECNLFNVEDLQCDVCLNFVVKDWYVTKSFKRHIVTGRPICLDCVKNLKGEQELQ